MPLARGIMQFGRINVYPTTTTLVSVNPPDVGFCGENITFTVTVSNNRGIGFPVPTGTVLIKDSLTNTTLASGSLSGGTSIIVSTISISNNQIYAQYVGIVNQFGASQSDPPIPYNVSLIDTITTATNTPGADFCFHNNFNLTAHVKRASNNAAVTSGTVQFNLYSDAVSFVTIGTASLNGSGDATIVLPADSTVPGNNYYVQALYLGATCFRTSTSPAGVSGTLIQSVGITQNTTTATVTGGSGSFCINSSRTFTASVSSLFLGGPSVGSVTFTAVKSPTTIILGTDSSVVSGVASINVAGGTFPSTGTWTVTAAYTGDGFCFGNSTSVGVSAIPSTFAVDFLKEAGPAAFCRAQSQIFSYVVSSTFAGTISGTFVLKSSLGTTLGTVITSGSSAGFVVQFTIAANVAVAGAQNFFVQFTPTVGSCYSSGNSSNFAVTVTSSSTQLPASTVLSISPASGSSFTTFMFTITVNKGSGVGPLDGAGSLNGSASLYRFDQIANAFVLVNNNIHIFDNGSFGSGSYSASGFPASTTAAYVVWNGNSCYASQISNLEPMDVFNPPH